ncbi:MAG: GNAT family N-acetyltransferase [Sterolibacterium sp.]|nr:GNAT family N-acetyltransferase [Sterolibacterium sp.]
MRNRDIIELFDLVAVPTVVDIAEYRLVSGDWAALASAARPVREAVFIREKGIAAALEWDALDAVSHHVVALDAAGQPIGTGRLLADGRIGRIAVLPNWRGLRVGVNLLRRLLGNARQLGLPQVYLHARADSAAFYRGLGFVSTGRPFMETGSPHVLMRRTL